MRDILFTLISMFVAGNVLTEWRNRKTLPWMSNPMSSYLAHVPWSWMQDVGFVALAAALALLSRGSTLSGILFLLGTASLFMAVLNKYISTLSKFHKISAAVPYTSVNAALLVRAWNTGGVSKLFALAAIGVAFLFMRFAPSQTSLEEKAVTACLMVALYAWIL